ncbi:MAG: 3-phosphoshikimate 1-carboxyvinyltransferase [Chlorobi bacterium]|nr:3-phosphoshikimate 1-carboxyvinyltransferase [Chlorobiota bacterium]
MTHTVRLQLKKKSLYGTCAISGSKSISNRLLIMAFLAGKNVHFKNLSVADDTRLLARSLKQIRICGSSQIPMIIDARNAGTFFRFLTAVLVTQKGLWHLTGSQRMTERPVGHLVDALRELGADIRYCSKEGYPPVNIRGCKLKKGEVDIDASVSSQFISALMLIGPCMSGGLQISLHGKKVSFPYVEMTRRLMNEFGIECRSSAHEITVPYGFYEPREMYVEPDWSSASYWYQMVALSDEAEIALPGFKKESVQGDRVCAGIFDKLGVETEYRRNGIILRKKENTEGELSLDLSGSPDLVPAVMVTCAAKKIPATFKGVGHLRFKESDRIESLSRELAKMGAKVTATGGTVRMTPGNELPGTGKIVFETYKDHRLAMALAPLVLELGQLTIEDPDVVEKSYPAFWKDIRNIGLCTVEKTG